MLTADSVSCHVLPPLLACCPSSTAVIASQQSATLTLTGHHPQPPSAITHTAFTACAAANTPTLSNPIDATATHLLQQVCHALPQCCLGGALRPLRVIFGQQVQQVLGQVGLMQVLLEGLLLEKLVPAKLPDLPGALVPQAPDALVQDIFQGHLDTKVDQLPASVNCRSIRQDAGASDNMPGALDVKARF